MKTTRLTIKYAPKRFRRGDGTIDAGPEVDVTYDRETLRLRVKGPKIDLLIDDVEAFDLLNLDFEETEPQ